MKLPSIFKSVFSSAIFFAGFLLISTFSAAFAQTTDIETTLNINFDLSDDSALVTETIFLKNTGDSTVALESYEFTLGLENPEDLNVLVDSQEVGFRSTSNNGRTRVILSLSSTVIKSSGQAEIKITYVDKNVVMKKGSRRVVSIAKFSIESNIKNFNYSISAPKSWGEVNYSSIQYAASEAGQKQVLAISEQESKTNDLLISFGNSQSYNMTLKYKIENSSSKKVVKKVAIPADSDTQEVIWQSASEAPDYSYQDFDGNYILNYILKPGESKTILFDLLINTKISETSNKTALDDSDQIAYTKPDVFWAVNDPTIVTLSKQITANKASNTEKAQEIVSYINEKLSYSEEAINNAFSERKGGLGTLNNSHNAICQNYVDLFVTIARSAEVPTRAVSGFAFPDSDKVHDLPNGVLHSWVEIWEKDKGWIGIDPTWEDTSSLKYLGDLGLGRIRWVTYGHSSTEPILPVGYNLLPNQSGLNAVTNFSTLVKSPDYSIKLDSLKDLKLDSLQNNTVNFNIENDGNVVITNLSMEIPNSSLTGKIENSVLKATEDEKFPTILTPFEKQDLTLSLEKIEILKLANLKDNIEIRVKGEYGSEAISEVLSSDVAFENRTIVIIAIWVLAGIILAGVLFFSFFIRRRIYENTSLIPKVHNIKPRKGLG